MEQQQEAPMRPIISIVVAMTPDGIIGTKGVADLLWRIPSDLRVFKKITTNNALLMGWNTFDAIYRRRQGLLPQRQHLVLTRGSHKAAIEERGAMPVHSIEEALRLFVRPDPDQGTLGLFLPDKDERSVGPSKYLYVIGGAEVYQQAMPFAQTLEITTVHAALPLGPDYAHFPEFDKTAYRVVMWSLEHRGEKDDYPTSFKLYQRKTPPRF